MRKTLTVASLTLVSTLAVAFSGATVTAAPRPHVVESWGVDAAHTEINFSATHFFTPVTGTFSDFDVTLDYDPENPESSTVEARIGVASVDTGNQRRDDHLRSADWFEVEKYPQITFKSTSVRRSSDGLVARGLLSIKGKSQEIELPIKLLGSREIPEQMREMLGGSKEVVSFNAAATIDRADFGVGVGSWATTMIVGGDIDIEILVEAHRR